MCRSPKLIAACHVLLRLLMPRHSPCALSSLTSSAQAPYRALCRLRQSLLTPLRLLFLADVHPLGRRREFSARVRYWFSELCRLIQDHSTKLLPCVAASSVSLALPFPAELTLSAAPPFPREFPFARMRLGKRRSLRSLSTIASEFPSVALLVFPLFSFQCAAFASARKRREGCTL